MPPYEYRPLTPPRAFRLFNLVAGGEKDPVKGTLAEYDLEFHSSYESKYSGYEVKLPSDHVIGVSYVWGKGCPIAEIVVEGCSLYITPSLHSLLTHLRYEHSHRILWIDQICIDQDNIEERNAQVREMGRIYQQAETNLVWLGETNLQTEIAFEALRRIVSSSTNSNISKEARTITSSEAQALRDVFTLNPLWTRVWIIQELLLAHKIRLVCGYDHLEWTFVEFICWISAQKKNATVESLQALESNTCPLINLCTERDRLRCTRKRPPLPDLLFLFQGQHASRELDKIYALLGLAEDVMIRPDYRKNFRQVCVDTVTSILNYYGHLDFICFDALSCPRRIRSLDLPSWVPDLHSGFAPLEPAFRTKLYRASGPIAPHRYPFNISGDIITAKGRQIDYIGDGQQLCRNRFSTPHQYLGFFASLPFQSPETTNDDLEHWDVVVRTMTVDVADMGGRLTKQDLPVHRLRFLEWLHALEKLVTTDDTRSLAARQAAWSYLWKGPRGSRFESKWDRKLILTRRGLLVSCKEGLAGDTIVVLETASVPLILRKTQILYGMNEYKIVGTAYVHGFMDGEALAKRNGSDEFPEQVYRIV